MTQDSKSKSERVEEIREEIINEIMVPPGEESDYPAEFHDRLDEAQDVLYDALKEVPKDDW